jgi:hypothetical protein
LAGFRYYIQLRKSLKNSSETLPNKLAEFRYYIQLKNIGWVSILNPVIKKILIYSCETQSKILAGLRYYIQLKKRLINSCETLPYKLAEFRYYIQLKKKAYLLAVRPSQKYWLGLDTTFSYKIKLNK